MVSTKHKLRPRLMGVPKCPNCKHCYLNFEDGEPMEGPPYYGCTPTLHMIRAYPESTPLCYWNCPNCKAQFESEGFPKQ